MVGTLITLVYDEARRIWCYRWLVIATTALIFAAGAAYIATMPNTYDAWAQIYVNKQTPAAVAAEGVGLVGDNYGSGYVVEKTLLNDQNLEPVVRKLNPNAATFSRAAMAGAVSRLKSKIRVSNEGGDGFFEFHYSDSDPVQAHRVVATLLNQFIEANVDRNQHDLNNASQFLDRQIASYETMLAQSRERLAAFHNAHPNFVAGGAAGVATVAAPVDMAGPVALAPAAAVAPRPSAAAEQVAALQARIATLKNQYTDNYPDVIEAKRQLANAQAALAAEKAAQPAQASAASAAAPRAAARGYAPVVRRATVSPVLQAEYADLQRNDDMLRSNYQQLLSRREATRMSQAVYADNNSKYQVTRVPVVPTFPTGPNRRLLLAAAAVASVLVGLGVGYLRGAINGIFVSPRELEETFQLPVVGTVSWEPAWNTKAAKRSPKPLALAASAGVLVAGGVVVAIAASPLGFTGLYMEIQTNVATWLQEVAK